MPTPSDSENSPIPDPVQHNLEKVEQFEKRQDEKRSRLQRVIEGISVFFSSSRFFIYFVGASVCWMVLNVAWHGAGHPYLDAPPFQMLQGAVTYIGVLMTMAVLVRQNRLSEVEESRAHLELQVNLLAEQKATKIIMLLEELRRDLPDVQNRSDPNASTWQTMTDADAVLDEIESRKAPPDGPEPSPSAR
ncbi:MAG: hypothetical protein JWQ01_4348 [Massilia sp.]|nr:hypothetical protein [Massilia sp.]